MEDVTANMQHLEALATKINKLNDSRKETAEALCFSIARRLSSGEISVDELPEFYGKFKDNYGPGHSLVWNRNIPVKACNLQWAVRNENRFKPNGPNGSWHGDRALQTDSPRPPKGTNVVYVLFDANNVPCYVGSTGDLQQRLSAHARDKSFEYWTASKFDTREQAYKEEDRLLRENKPYLNRKAYR